MLAFHADGRCCVVAAGGMELEAGEDVYSRLKIYSVPAEQFVVAKVKLTASPEYFATLVAAALTAGTYQ